MLTCDLFCALKCYPLLGRSCNCERLPVLYYIAPLSSSLHVLGSENDGIGCCKVV